MTDDSDIVDANRRKKVETAIKQHQERGNSYVKAKQIASKLEHLSSMQVAAQIVKLEEDGKVERYSTSNATVWRITEDL